MSFVQDVSMNTVIIDCEAGEIIHTAVSARLFVCLFVCMSELSCLNRLTYNLHFWCYTRNSSSGVHKLKTQVHCP